MGRTTHAAASLPRGSRGERRANGHDLVQPPTRNVSLLESKLTLPPERPGTIRRAGPVNRLRSARDAKVVSVTAPAGYGKTTLVADWARRDERRFAWYGLDESDDGDRFIAHLHAAIARALVDGENTSGVEHGRSESAGTVAMLGQRLVESDWPIVVVLDAIERLHDAESFKLLGRLIDELPSDAQLALVGRAEVPLPLARLRAQGLLMELDIDDLRFSNREASALLRNSGVVLPPRRVEELNNDVEGWPAALRLAALSLRPRANGAPASPRPVDPPNDYFGDLLSGFSDEQAQLLTRISVLHRLCGALCDVVAETCCSAELLEQLRRSNLFVIPLDREGRWYRLHPAFQRFLAGEVERREPSSVSALRSRAACWCSSHGYVDDAIEYACAAGDLEQLVDLFQRSSAPFGSHLKPMRVQALLRTVDDETLLKRNPAVAVMGAVTWAMTGCPEEAERWSRTVERREIAGREPCTDSSATSAPWGALLRALSSPNGLEQLEADAQRALATLPPTSVWRSAALLGLSIANGLKGFTSTADACAREAADVAVSSDALGLESMAVAFRSLLAADRGDWQRADLLADDARRRISDLQLDDDVTSLFGLAASARAALRNGDWTRVRRDIELARRLLPGLTYAIGTFAVFLRLQFARVELALGAVEGASRLLDEIDDIFRQQPRLGVFRQEALALRVEVADQRQGPESGASSLTAAELRLLPFLTTHMSFREIADGLYVSRNTVKTQAISVYRKLGVCSRGSAIARASKLGLVADKA